MPGAARLGDKAQVQQDAHGCPACPHPGTGPIIGPCSSNVTINDRPAALQDDFGMHAICCGPNLYNIKKGSPTVYVNGKPLARLHDATKHCGGNDGEIIEGSENVLIDDGASAQGLGSYLINALRILVAQAAALAKQQAKQRSDTHGGAAAGKPAQEVAKDAKPDKKAGSISAARWTVQRALNGQQVELQIECKNPKGSLKIEIWAQSADPTQDKPVSKIDAQAAAVVKKKVKLDIPPDAAGTNECHFYFVVKDDSGGERRSDSLFVDRSPFRFSI